MNFTRPTAIFRLTISPLVLERESSRQRMAQSIFGAIRRPDDRGNNSRPYSDKHGSAILHFPTCPRRPSFPRTTSLGVSTSLNFTPEALAGNFPGPAITKWNDPAIAGANKGREFCLRRISSSSTEADGSGTGVMYSTDYPLQSEFGLGKTKSVRGTSVNWPARAWRQGPTKA